MIRTLRCRFIIITMSCISFIFILILLSLNITMKASNYKHGYNLLEMHAKRSHANTTHGFPHGDWLDDIRIISVTYNQLDDTFHFSNRNNPNLKDEDVIALARTALNTQKEQGVCSDYLFMITAQETRTYIHLLDYGPEIYMSKRLTTICLWVGLCGIIAIFIPVFFLSRLVTVPVHTAFEKQRQFIADASHELKTPLTIITTNAEVLDNSIPDNKWVAHILEQSKRMKWLINNLLDLARLDSSNEKKLFVDFDLSKALKASALSFESIAYEYHKNYHISIDENITLYGNESEIKQLAGILLDNAFKFSDENGTITISLSKRGEKKELQVCNTGIQIPEAEHKHIFERFYRSDSSRSRETGGYGLGLSIAHAIVTSHKGNISVTNKKGRVTCFTVLFP